jgi:uncharacterized membrane protein HdeD (DUF308 family)
MADDQGTGSDSAENGTEQVGNERVFRYFAPLMMVKGAVGLLAGTVLIFWPRASLGFTAVILGIFLLTDGIEKLVSLLRREKTPGRYDLWSVVGSILRIVFGAVLLFNPSEAGGFWAGLFFVLAGLNLIAGSLVLFWSNPELKNDLLGIGATLIMLTIGLIMVLLPLGTAVVLLRILGIVLVFGSVPTLAVGLRSRK